MPANASGAVAEEAVAEYLLALGYEVLARNWRTRRCEIDLIARKDRCVYFVEVKYRKTAWQGEGWQYITPQKLRQMTFAARVWMQANAWNGASQLAAASVFGLEFMVTDFWLIDV